MRECPSFLPSHDAATHLRGPGSKVTSAGELGVTSTIGPTQNCSEAVPRRRVMTMAPAPPSKSKAEPATSGTDDEPVDGSAVRASTLTDADVGGATVASATVGGATVDGATVGGATVSGAEVLGATVVGVTVVAGGSVVGASVVVATTVVVGTGQAGMLVEPGQKGPAALIWVEPTTMPAARPRPARAASPDERPCRFRACVPFMSPA